MDADWLQGVILAAEDGIVTLHTDTEERQIELRCIRKERLREDMIDRTAMGTEPMAAYDERSDALPDADATTELPGRPTELPAPFRKRLPPLNPDARIERAEGGLRDADLCAAMAKIDAVARLARDRLAVSAGRS